MAYDKLTPGCAVVLYKIAQAGGSVPFSVVKRWNQTYVRACYVRRFLDVQLRKERVILTIKGERALGGYRNADINRRDITRPLTSAFQIKVIPIRKGRAA